MSDKPESFFVRQGMMYRYHETRPFAYDYELLVRKADYDKLKAELWVAKDSQLRTYDGLAEKADKYDDIKKELSAVKLSVQSYIDERDKAQSAIKVLREIIRKHGNSFAHDELKEADKILGNQTD